LYFLQSSGIDDAETECDLDGLTDWDWIIVNNGNEPELEDGMQNIVSWVNRTLNL
jgi:phosphomevalonate kinase